MLGVGVAGSGEAQGLETCHRPVLPACLSPRWGPGLSEAQSPLWSRTGTAQGSYAVKQELSLPRAKRPRALCALATGSSSPPTAQGPKRMQCWDNQRSSLLDPDSDEPRGKPSPGPLTEGTGLRG